MYRIIAFLPRERLVWGRPPKCVQLTLVFEERSDRSIQTSLKIAADGFRVKGIGVFAGKVRQGGEEDRNVADVPHRALIVMQTLEVILWRSRKQGRDNLRHITEFPESDPQLVEAGRLIHIKLVISLVGCDISTIDHLEQAGIEPCVCNP
jgi:hypothetical protein